MSSRIQHVTSTGWRIVGEASARLANEIAEHQLAAGREEDTLFIVRLTARRWLGAGSATDDVVAALGSAVAEMWPETAPLTRTKAVVRPPARFEGLRWVVAGEAGSWKGELLWRHSHPFIPGAPLTTHVIIEEQQRITTINVKVTADGGIASVRGRVGSGQARPAFLTQLNKSLRLQFDGFDSEPLRIGIEDIAPFVSEILLSEAREVPVAVLTPLEDGTFETHPETFADELLGLARLYVINDHRSTFALTDSLGDRRLSAYWGAVRVYMPEFSCADSPLDHPLLVRERASDPVMRAELVGRLAHYAKMRIQMPQGPIDAASVADALPTAGKRQVPETVDRKTATQPRTSIADSRGHAERDSSTASPVAPGVVDAALAAQISRLSEAITSLGQTMSTLSDEINRLRTSSAVRASSTNSLERRLGNLTALLERHLIAADRDEHVSPAETAPQPIEQNDPEQTSLVETVKQASESHSDALLILDNAERSAAASPYMDTDRAAVVLDAMADVARRRQNGSLQMSLRDAFRDLGVEYRGGIAPGTSEKMRRQYQHWDSNGRVFDCFEHICIGNSYDPRHCLRIYFTSRAPTEIRFVIGHVGRHLDVESTT